MTITRRRKIIYGLLTLAMVSGLTVLALIVADVYVHWRTQHQAGVNVWGYRGDPAPRKQPGESRVVMLGGSTTFGWGLPSHESIPAFLEHKLRDAMPGRRFSVINLGAPGQGAYGFVFDLVDFAHLDYDIVILYEGYNDLPFQPLGLNNFLLWRRQSPVFRWTGYHPILPIVLREKATAMLQGGDINAAQVRFEPGLATRATASALRAAATLTDGVTGKFGKLSEMPPAPAVDDQCIETWKRYCGSVREAVEWARERGKAVIYVTQPFKSDAHVEQQANVAAMLRARFDGDRDVQYVNLGRVIDLSDPAVAYDGLHLVASGNATIADHLLRPVIEAARP